MAKFYGIIGYATTTESETAPGVWEDEVVERSYTGDVVKNNRVWRSTDNVNPDLTISDTISVIADGFTLENVHAMKYVKWMNAIWAITSIRVERPRVILEIGGLYSGPTVDESEDESA